MCTACNKYDILARLVELSTDYAPNSAGPVDDVPHVPPVRLIRLSEAYDNRSPPFQSAVGPVGSHRAESMRT